MPFYIVAYGLGVRAGSTLDMGFYGISTISHAVIIWPSPDHHHWPAATKLVTCSNTCLKLASNSGVLPLHHEL
ncbi:hypothetical protein HZ326_27308 [Fusarium oxysporum f. sp. albedinis]|nr:hypothetical protein HZ326_27308 [Fusarium oxysporum f. sp. albedinis]